MKKINNLKIKFVKKRNSKLKTIVTYVNFLSYQDQCFFIISFIILKTNEVSKKIHKILNLNWITCK